MAVAALDLVFGLMMAVIAASFWTARRRAPDSFLDLVRTGPFDAGTRGRAVYSYGMTAWTAMMALVALGGAVGNAANALR